MHRSSLQVATPPANDLIENATPIASLPFSATQSTQDAMHSTSDPAASCFGAAATVWYRYDAPATQLLRSHADARILQRSGSSSTAGRRGR